MDEEILKKISYGLYIITAHKDGKDNGCVMDTAMQVASHPVMISASLNKNSLTCLMIQNTNRFTISIMDETADFDLFRRFGFQSGKDVDKFKDFDACKRVHGGTLAITSGTNAYISVDVTEKIDLGSHILFVGKPIDGDLLGTGQTMTYADYLKRVKNHM